MYISKPTVSANHIVTMISSFKKSKPTFSISWRKLSSTFMPSHELENAINTTYCIYLISDV